MIGFERKNLYHSYTEEVCHIDGKKFTISTTIYDVYKPIDDHTQKKYALYSSNRKSKVKCFIKDVSAIIPDKENKIFHVMDYIEYDIAGAQKSTKIEFILDLDGNVMGNTCYIDALHRFVPFSNTQKGKYMNFKIHLKEQIEQEMYKKLNQNPNPFTLSFDFIENTDFCLVHHFSEKEQKVYLYNHRTERDATPHVQEIIFDDFDQTFCVRDVIKVNEEEVVSLEFMLSVTGEQVGDLFINGKPYSIEFSIMEDNFIMFQELKKMLQIMYVTVPVEQILKLLL